MAFVIAMAIKTAIETGTGPRLPDSLSSGLANTRINIPPFPAEREKKILDAVSGEFILPINHRLCIYRRNSMNGPLKTTYQAA